MSEQSSKTYPENAPGPFYVQRDECIICRAPEYFAPDLIGFYEAPSGKGASSHCYFKKQPQTEGEIGWAIKAVQANCCGSYHYAGEDAAIKEALKLAHCGHAIDE